MKFNEDENIDEYDICIFIYIVSKRETIAHTLLPLPTPKHLFCSNLSIPKCYFW